MSEEASKGILRKFGDKAVEELSKSLVQNILTLGIWGVLGTWAAAEWSCIIQPRCEIAGWSLGLLLGLTMLLVPAALFLGGALLRTRRRLREAETRETAPSPAPALQPVPFQKIEVKDRPLKLLWRI